jgi:hypothetical protein
MKKPMQSGGEALPEIQTDAVTRINNLALELSQALNEYHPYQGVVIHPSKDREYPVEISLNGHYRRMTNAMFAYRDAVLSALNSTENAEVLAVVRDTAHKELLATFIEVRS